MSLIFRGYIILYYWVATTLFLYFFKFFYGTQSYSLASWMIRTIGHIFINNMNHCLNSSIFAVTIFGCEDAAQQVLMSSVCPCVRPPCRIHKDRISTRQYKTVQDSTKQYKTVAVQYSERQYKTGNKCNANEYKSLHAVT